ncbi:Uncharacterized protein PKNOH_S06416600, partial [Plasmodium knowlesi]
LSGVPLEESKREEQKTPKGPGKNHCDPPPTFSIGKMFLLNENEESPKDILMNELKYKIRVLAGVVFVIRTIPMVLSLFNKSAD